jgi:hypothetical protein
MEAPAKAPGDPFPLVGAAADLKQPDNSLMERMRRPISLSSSTSHAIRWPTLSGISFRTSSGMVTCHLEVIVDIAFPIAFNISPIRPRQKIKH